jgi:hypothetical protein
VAVKILGFTGGTVVPSEAWKRPSNGHAPASDVVNSPPKLKAALEVVLASVIDLVKVVVAPDHPLGAVIKQLTLKTNGSDIASTVVVPPSSE